MKAWQLNTRQWQHFREVFDKIHGKADDIPPPMIRCEGTPLSYQWKEGRFSLEGLEYQSYRPSTQFGRFAMLAVRRDFLNWASTILAQKERIYENQKTRPDDGIISLI